MRLIRAFVTHEARLQLRSMRGRLLFGAYAALSLTPVVLLYVSARRSQAELGAATFAFHLFAVNPSLTALFSAILGLTSSVRELEEGSLPVLGVARIGNAGYVLRRWVAVVALALPATLVPLAVTAALARAAGAPFGDPGAFVWPWALHIAPLVLTFSALGVGLGTIAGSVLWAGGAAIFLPEIILGMGNDLLARFGRQIDGPGDWVEAGQIQMLVAVLSRFGDITMAWFDAASEAPVVPGVLAASLASRAAPTIGLAAAILFLSPLFLRRTRADNRPWRIRQEHPLRTFLNSLNRARVDLSPEPAPSLVEKALVVAALLAFAAGTGYTLARGEHFRERGMARYEAEMSGEPSPTPPGFVPKEWKVTGEIHGGGQIEIDLEASFKNEGGEPVRHLAMELNPGLAPVEIAEGARPISHRRLWDRLSIDLERPVLPGEERRLRFKIRGTPATEELAGERPGVAFVTTFGGQLEARLANYLTDLSRSSRRLAVSRRRIALDARSLYPVPRYGVWTLTPASMRENRLGRVVPPEWFFPEAEIAIDLGGPRGALVVDACGNVAGRGTPHGRLQGRCRLSPGNYAVLGGSHLLVEVPGMKAVGAIPVHVEALRRHIPALASASDLASRVLPGEDPLAEMVILEWPPPYDPRQDFSWGSWGLDRFFLSQAQGRILLISEERLISPVALSSEQMAADLVATTLAGKRPVVRAEALLFRHFFRSLALMKLGRDQGCVVIRDQAEPAELGRPLLEAGSWDSRAWNVKLPALAAYLQARVGESALALAVAEFLAEKTPSPGTMEELLGLIGRRSGTSLERIYEDYFAGGALPVLTLEDVLFKRRAKGWEVSGRLTNKGTGETECLLEVRTDLQPLRTTVKVDSGGSISFLLSGPDEPRILLLDPLRRCYRFQPKGVAVTQVLFKESA